MSMPQVQPAPQENSVKEMSEVSRKSDEFRRVIHEAWRTEGGEKVISIASLNPDVDGDGKVPFAPVRPRALNTRGHGFGARRCHA